MSSLPVLLQTFVVTYIYIYVENTNFLWTPNQICCEKWCKKGRDTRNTLNDYGLIRAGETIPLPTASLVTNMAGTGTLKEGGSETKEFQARYGDTGTSLTARTPYFSVPIVSDATEESLDDACLGDRDNAQSSQETQDI